MGFGDKELSRSVQLGLRVSLVRRFLTDDLEYINTAKNYLHVARLLRHRAARRLAGRLARQAGRQELRPPARLPHRPAVRASTPTRSASFKMPKTWYVTSDGLLAFLDHNHLQDIHNRKYLEIEQVRKEYPHIVQAFKNSELPEGGPEGPRRGARRHRRQAADRAQLEPARGPDRVGLLGQVQEPVPGEPRAASASRLAAAGDAVAEVYASHLQPRSHRVPRRARPARPPRGDGRS